MKPSVTMVVWWVVIAGLFGVAVLSGIVEPGPGVAALLIVCFACELLDSSIGMGFGTTLTPVLLLAGFEPHQLVPTILVSEFVSGFASFFFHAEAGNVRLERGSPHLRVGVILSLFSVIGVVGGVEVALRVSGLTLTRIIGAIILLMGLVILLAGRRRFSYRHWKIGLLALVASFNKAISGGGYGPLMTGGQVLSGVDSKASVAITSLAEGFTCLGGAMAFLVLGQTIDPGLLIPVVTGALLSVPLSAQVVKRAGEDLVKRLIGALTILLGSLTLVRSFL